MSLQGDCSPELHRTQCGASVVATNVPRKDEILRRMLHGIFFARLEFSQAGLEYGIKRQGSAQAIHLCFDRWDDHFNYWPHPDHWRIVPLWWFTLWKYYFIHSQRDPDLRAIRG